MFKWGKRDSKASYEPKTPKLPSVSLPAGRFTPITTIQSPPTAEKPISNLLFRHFTPDRRHTTSALEGRHTPLDTSRSRTVSSPSRHLQAPRPIRPHPSQGPFVPIMDHHHSVVINPSRAPISVPSAQYLEEQIRRLPAEPLKPRPDMTQKILDAEFDYPEEKRLREVVSKQEGMEVNRVISKAYTNLLEEDNPKSTSTMKKGKLSGLFSSGKSSKRESLAASSKHDPVDFDEWNAVPIKATPQAAETGDKRSSLKPALKKTSSTYAPAPPKPVMKAEEPAKAYYSEDETQRRRSDRPKTRGSVTRTASKAWLEEQEEKREEIRRRSLGSRSSYRQPSAPAVYGPSAFPPSNSTTPSPVDPIYAPEYYRPRRASHASEPRSIFNNNNYMPAYIRSDPERERKLLEEIKAWGEGNVHARLTWPMIDYAARKREPMPLILFDAGFNPRIPKYAVKAKRGPYFSPLTREEETMNISTDNVFHVTLINRKLDRWPIHIHLPNNIRVIDVFRAIYDIYSQPLTPYERDAIGTEAIARCYRAFKQRCEDGPDFSHNEERKGLLRIDLLRGRRIFKGLVPVPGKSDTFELLFDEGR